MCQSQFAWVFSGAVKSSSWHYSVTFKTERPKTCLVEVKFQTYIHFFHGKYTEVVLLTIKQLPRDMSLQNYLKLVKFKIMILNKNNNFLFRFISFKDHSLPPYRNTDLHFMLPETTWGFQDNMPLPIYLFISFRNRPSPSQNDPVF